MVAPINLKGVKMLVYFQAKNIQNIAQEGISLTLDRQGNILIGPNASGKSNILKSISFLKELITSKNLSALHPYRFSKSEAYSSIVAVFKINNLYYRYSVKFYLTQKIFEEEHVEKSSDNKAFTSIVRRKKDEIEYIKPVDKMAIDTQTSVIALFRLLKIDDEIEILFHFVNEGIYFLSSQESNIKEYLISLHNDKRSGIYFDLMSQRLRELKLGIQSIDVSPPHYGKRDIVLYHYDIDQLLSIDLESKGTQRLIEIIYLLCVIKPKVVIIDEVENTIHPSVIKQLMLYALEHQQQIIFSTHTRELIDIDIYEKHSSKKIFFVRKDAKGFAVVTDTSNDSIELDIKDSIYSEYYHDLFAQHSDKFEIQ